PRARSGSPRRNPPLPGAGRRRRPGPGGGFPGRPGSIARPAVPRRLIADQALRRFRNRTMRRALTVRILVLYGPCSFRDPGEMLKIGYIRLRDQDPADEGAALKAIGCHVVRAEDQRACGGGEAAVLASILDFVGPGDQLVVSRLGSLGGSA